MGRSRRVAGHSAARPLHGAGHTPRRRRRADRRDFRVLLANDADETVAYGRKTGSQAAVVALNRSSSERTLSIPVGGYLPDGTSLERRLGVGVAASGSVSVAGGSFEITLPAMSALVLATDLVDLIGPAAPTNLHVTGEGANELSVAWDGSPVPRRTTSM